MKIPYGWELPEEVTVRLGRKRAGRQRSIVEKGHLLLILHRPPAKDVDEPEAAMFWRNPEGTWKASSGGGLASLRDHLQAYSKRENELEATHNRSKNASELFDLLEMLSPLSRAAAHQYEAIQAARAAIGPDPELLDLRDEAYLIQRSFDLLYTEAKHSLEYDIARRAEEQAELSNQAVLSAHKLNTLMALFLPLTAVASIFGMNLPSGFEHLSQLAFWSVLGSALLLGWLVRVWILRPGK